MELAGAGLAGWTAAAPQASLDRIAGWLRVSDHGLRAFRHGGPDRGCRR